MFNDFPHPPGSGRQFSMVLGQNAPAIKDIVISANTDLPSTLDGGMVTMYARNLTIEAGATLTVANRCKGLRIICFGDCDIYGTISMTARGAYAAGLDTPIAVDSLTAFSVKFPAAVAEIEQYMKNFFTPGNDFSDLPASLRPELTRQAMSQTTIGTVPAVGGAGGASRVANGPGGTGYPGSNGINRQCGGGGSGGDCNYGTSGAGAPGTAYSGGSGGGAVSSGSSSVSPGFPGSANGGAGGAGRTYGTSVAAGGGAGNPGGVAVKTAGTAYNGSDGTGGLLILIVLGNLSVHGTGTIESKGSAGGSASGTSYCAGGGGSGGGSINIAHGGSFSNIGTITATGGPGGVTSSNAKDGGAGGAGCITIEQVNFSGT